MAPTTSGRRNPLVRRALAAYFGQRTSEIWPYTGHVRVVADAGGTERTYVVLVGAADDVLAVYRVHNDGQLKLLSRRWPPRPAPPPPKPPAQPGPDTPTEGTTP